MPTAPFEHENYSPCILELSCRDRVYEYAQDRLLQGVTFPML
jgi:hypothetical protein